MKYLFVTILLSFINLSFSQEIIGTWKVKNVEPIEVEKQNKYIQEIFTNANFIFKSDTTFKFISPNKSKATIEFSKIFLNTKWVYDKEKNEIILQLKEDNSLISAIVYKEENNKYYFTFYEVPVVLEMEKIKQ